MTVIRIDDENERRAVARRVLEALPDWFGIESAREEYIENSAYMVFFAAMDADNPMGFICVRKTGDKTAEIAVMGVMKEYHRRGIGRALFDAAKESARAAGCEFLQVKTVRMGIYEDYDRTNRFYRSLGFAEFEVFPLLWDEYNPCQIYVMAL